MTIARRKQRTIKKQRRGITPSIPRQTQLPSPASPAIINLLPIHRDGLDWLADKGRITLIERKAGLAYRHAYVLAQAEGVPIRSCIGGQIGGGEGRVAQPMAIAEIEAKERLHTFRSHVLLSQVNALHAVDQVCGHGRTVMEMANGNDRVATRYEAYLKVALGMLAEYLWPTAVRALRKVG